MRTTCKLFGGIFVLMTRISFDTTKKDLLPASIFTILGMAGLYKTFSDIGMFATLSGKVMYFLIFFFSAVLMLFTAALIRKDGADSKKILKYSVIYGTLFGIATDMGYQFKVSEMTDPGIKGKGFIFITGVCLSFLLLPVTYNLFRYIDGTDRTGRVIKGSNAVRVFVSSWVIIQLLWTPAFLAYYPAILSYDFHRQFGEAVRGYQFFYEYQPLVHTFLIRMAYLLGTRIGDPAAGMAVLAFVQSLVLAASISAGITFVYKKSGTAAWIFWLASFALLPFNPVLAISMTKDIFFSAFFVLIILVVIRMQDKLTVPGAAAFVILGVLNILFRNNAAYALIFLAPAFLITEKGLKKKIVCSALVICTVIAGLGCKNGIRNVMGAIPGSEMEKYSVPIMQMVRVSAYQDSNLTQDQRAILEHYLMADVWGDYFPWLADSAKATLAMYRSEAWLEDTPQLAKDYIKLGLAYPNDYIDAFVGLTLGYWFIDDTSHAEMLGFGDDTDMGLLYTFNSSKNDTVPDGIQSKSMLPGLEKVYSHIVNGNAYYSWPLVSQLMKPAFYFWLFVLSIFACIYRRNKKSISIFAYPFFYFLTMLLGPCVNFRYIYPFIVSIPVLISFALSCCNRKKNGKDER